MIFFEEGYFTFFLIVGGILCLFLFHKENKFHILKKKKTFFNKHKNSPTFKE
jgi:hypothetical protein